MLKKPVLGVVNLPFAGHLFLPVKIWHTNYRESQMQAEYRAQSFVEANGES